MANYTHDYSKFPSSIIEKKEFKDITADVAPYFEQYFQLMLLGDTESAQKIIVENSLDPYIVNAYIFNWLVEEIRNTQIYAKTKGQQIIYVDSIDDLPDNPVDGDIYRVKRS